MDKVLRKIAVLAAAVAVVSCSGKLDDEVNIPEIRPVNLSVLQTEVLQAGQGFGFDLFHCVASAAGNKSVFISPASLQVALMMAANGAKGDTYREIVETMGYAGYSVDDINSMYSRLIQGLTEVDTSTQFEIANSAWINGTFPIYKDYASTLSCVFKAGCRSIDFRSNGALGQINGWCSDNTHGMIRKLYDSLDDDWQFILMNTLYFKGIWASKFNASNTSSQTFNVIDGGSTAVSMMHQTSEFQYSENLEAQFCALPFGNTAFELDIVLPHADVDFAEYLSQFNADKLNSFMDMSGKSKVRLSVPKVELDCFTQFNDVLQKMGIITAFSNYAQFSAISEEPLKISDVRQKAVFKMDESGAEAAAVTGIAFEKITSAGPEKEYVFTADHPFILVIRERTSGAILFMGSYTGCL